MAALSLKGLEPVFDKFEALTKLQRIILFIVVFLLLIGGFFYFSFLPKLKTIEDLKEKYELLDAQLVKIRRDAAKLEMWREKKRAAQEQFNLVMRQLPDSDEIPSLLGNITHSGQDVGLEFLQFTPQAEVKKDFYAEIPVAVSVVGGYHDVARFFDRVSRLSRIVNIQNVGMKPTKDRQGNILLTTSCTAVTYKFVEPPVVETKPKKRRR